MKVRDMLIKVNLNLNNIYELEVEENFITGMAVILDIPLTVEMNEKYEKEIIETGYWVYHMVGHSAEFYFNNFDTVEEAEAYIKEVKDDYFVFDAYILDI